MNRIGILLMNTGTPQAPDSRSVRAYLAQFLSDPRVIDIAPLLRFLLLQVIILPFRSRKSAKAYAQVWTEKGSPLLVYSEAYARKLQDKLGDSFLVRLGMRYGQPSIEKACQDLASCTHVLLFPLFPHYASSSTGSALEEALRHLSRQWNVPTLQTVAPFYAEPEFLESYTQHLQKELSRETWDHLIFSFHGLPLHHIEKSLCKMTCTNAPCTDVQAAPFCYRSQCFHTASLLQARVPFAADSYTVAFQSRLGRRPWIQPYFDELLPRLYKQGKRRLVIVCASFVADCLETLEEIQIRAQESWLELGGESLKLIPCLNDSDLWIDASADLIRRTLNTQE